jgi:RecB family exonuclease
MSRLLPSRWLLPSLRGLSGQPRLEASGWESVSGRWLDGSPSYAAVLARGNVLPSEQEWRIRALLAGRGAGMTVDEVQAGDEVAGRAMAMIRGWASDGLTRYDGDVSGHGIPGPADAGQVVSPTALEEWARCPHAYFVKRLLRVEPPGTPEELVKISPLETGSLIHEVLDRFFTGQSGAGTVPGGWERWTDAQRGELECMVLEVAAEFESRGVTGHPLLWRQERNRIAADLQLLLGDDELLRAQTGRVQVRSELSFGMRERPPVRVGLSDGREIWFRGSADRVDRAGSALVVVDYKTGSAGSFKTISAADPTADGTKLQLPVYAHAARAGLGTAETGVSAEYWFLRKDRGKRVTLTLTPEVNEAYGAALAVIADGIADGLFPHRPPDGDGWAGYVECSYCDTDGLGVKEVRDRWERKRRDPRLGRYLELVDPAAVSETS